MATITYKLHKNLRYSVTGKCESCGKPYDFSKDINVGAVAQTSSHRPNVDKMRLVTSSISATKNVFWDVLKNIFAEPKRFGVVQSCSSCGHMQSWMTLPHIREKSKISFFFRSLIKPTSAYIKTPTAPSLRISTPDTDTTSIHDYPIEIPFELDQTVQSCLFFCLKKGVLPEYVKYLGAKTLMVEKNRISRTERENILNKISYLQIIKNAGNWFITNPVKMDNAVLFALAMRINRRNWRNLARLAEDFHLRYVSREKIMRLLLDEENGGISDIALDEDKAIELYFKVDRRIKEIVICKECKGQMLIPIDPLPAQYTCPNCGKTKKCSWHQMPHSMARHIRLE
ncbi:hypothetical protein JW890_04895 [candidate division WOR-3 bacterium]|nr:hypothetical protein [candidate division WOR-3 bacterium]